MKILQKRVFQVGLLLLLLAVLVLLVLYACGVFFGGNREVSVHFYTPDGEDVKRVTAGESLALEPAGEIENYTFIGWRDRQGNLEGRETITIFQETYYSAVYAVSLRTDTHMAYLFPDEYGLFRPYGEMSRGDAAVMLYTLLSLPVKGSEGFMDVPQTAACYEATAALKELGVVSGSRFHPDEGITKAELIQMLAAFYPASRESYDFTDVNKSDISYPAFCAALERGWIGNDAEKGVEPNHIMTRVETAALVNRILGRGTEEKASPSQVGCLLDMAQTDDGYWDMAEACVSHNVTVENGQQNWADSVPFEKMPAGRYLFGLALYCVDDGGHLVRNAEKDGFTFDETGCYTSGNTELDALIGELFSKLVDASMQREEMLHTVYDYTVRTFTYLGRNHYPYQDSSWAVEEAYTMLSTGKGNCYNYAAAFCMMARALGFDAVVYSGFIGIDPSQHAWVEIDIDGVTYTFDPEIEYSYKRDYKSANMYMMPPEEAKKWSYTH